MEAPLPPADPAAYPPPPPRSYPPEVDPTGGPEDPGGAAAEGTGSAPEDDGTAAGDGAGGDGAAGDGAQPGDTAVTPQQLLLGAGVATVFGTALTAFAVGTPAGVAAVTSLLLVAAVLAVRAGYAGTRTTGEALALGASAAAATLVVVGGATAPRPALAAGTLAAFVVALTLALRLVSPQLRTWPVASWVALQCTVLVVVRTADLPAGPLGGVLLGTALVGLAVAWFGEGTSHGPVSWAGLLGSVPWWVAGVWVVQDTAWSGDGGAPATALAAALGVGAALGLLATTQDRVPDLPVAAVAVPVLAGCTGGSVLAGAAASTGPDWVLGSGFLGLGLAALVAVAAARGPAWVPRDAGLAAAGTLTLLAAIGTAGAGRWGDLGMLLVTTTAAAVLLSVRNRESRPSTAPIAVGAGALAVVALAGDGSVSGAGVGTALVAVAVTALAQSVVLAVVLPRRAAGRRGPDDPVHDVRDAFAAADAGRAPDPAGQPAVDPGSPDERAAASTAGTAVAVGLLGVATAAGDRAWGVTAVLLAVLGLALMAHADALGGARPPDGADDAPEEPGGGTAVLGGLAVVAACWIGAAQLGWGAVETVSVPAGIVLLAGRRRSLADRPSARTWGPGLAVALLPSVLLAGLDPEPVRQLLVLAASVLLALGGLGWEVRAPFLLGLVGVLGVALGWVAQDAPSPWVLAAGVAGAVLVGAGVQRERQQRRGEPVAAWLRTFR